ncbi:MAG TPA: hypothetical protein VMH41_13210 [Mycobacteriales bacterium]|nr:hypothetical protein [Mycobacteriales bacterium]
MIRSVAAGFAAALTLMAALPAAAVPTATPRNGSFSGTETEPTADLAVSFTVVRHARVTAFNGTAQVKPGCTNPITSYQTPYGPFAIGPKGKFSGVSSSYPKPAPTVRVTGRFTSPKKAVGIIAITFAKKKGCSARRHFTARFQP